MNYNRRIQSRLDDLETRASWQIEHPVLRSFVRDAVRSDDQVRELLRARESVRDVRLDRDADETSMALRDAEDPIQEALEDRVDEVAQDALREWSRRADSWADEPDEVREEARLALERAGASDEQVAQAVEQAERRDRRTEEREA